MENLFEHLVKFKGETEAYRFVHWMYSNMNIGIHSHIDKQTILDIREAVPMIGYEGCINELAHMSRLAYTIEKFIDDTDKNKLHNIIMDFEIWDKAAAEQRFFEIVSRCLRQ